MSEYGRYNLSPPPPCCGSGCTVCVLDYWPTDEESSDMECLLKAFEEAQDSHDTHDTNKLIHEDNEE